jgi:hypothetical protein
METGEFDLLETDAENIPSEQFEEGAANGDTLKDPLKGIIRCIPSLTRSIRGD